MSSESLQKSLDTLESAYALLEAAETQSEADTKRFILDSFHVSKTVKEYKEWEHQHKAKAIEAAVSYNRVTGEMERTTREKEELMEEYEGLRRDGSLDIPSWTVERKSLEELNDPNLPTHNLPDVVPLNKLYSVDSGSDLAFPDYEQFCKLVNIDLRLKVEKKLKLEVLSHIRNQIQEENRKWTSRERELSDFFDRQLPKIINSVGRIRKEMSITDAPVDDEDMDESEDTATETRQNEDTEMLT